jgi:murein DD-endopeptidase MepM/ murein hydrolase activator NlpD
MKWTFLNKLIVLFVVYTIFFLNYGVLAQNDSASELVDQIYETPDFLPLIDIAQAKITLQDLAVSVQKMQTDYKQVQEKKTYLEERFGDMAKNIERTIAATERNKTLILDTLTKIASLESNLLTLGNQLVELKADLKTGRDQIVNYLRFVYQSYQSLYWTTDTFSSWKQLIWWRAADVGITAQEFAQMLTLALDRQLMQIQEKQLEYEEKTKQLNLAKVWYTQAAKQLQKDLKRLEEQKTFLYAQLRAIQTDKAAIDAQAMAMRNHKDKLESELKKVQKITLESWGSTSAQVAKLLELPDRTVWKNYLTWPLLPPFEFDLLFWELKDGWSETPQTAEYLRMEIAQGEYVYASAPALVYSVFYGEDEWASQIVLLHKQGRVTVYTPMEEIFVRPGDLVRRGQVIWTSGGTPWTKWSWPDSQTAHLDFYVFLNASPKDPFEALDLSLFTKEQLPDVRHQKRLDDRYAREASLDSMPKATWKTVAERADNFLRRYASWPFSDSALRYDAAEWQWIDPLLWICVGFAETSFKSFKTDNNIWNVWNNDRGDTVTYVTPIQWARALYGVLNNKYLWGYYTLNELSRFGNSDGFIYASSPYNRQRNIMRCMSAIYGYPIAEDFPFRRPR